MCGRGCAGIQLEDDSSYHEEIDHDELGISRHGLFLLTHVANQDLKSWGQT